MDGYSYVYGAKDNTTYSILCSSLNADRISYDEVKLTNFGNAILYGGKRSDVNPQTDPAHLDYDYVIGQTDCVISGVLAVTGRSASVESSTGGSENLPDSAAKAIAASFVPVPSSTFLNADPDFLNSN